MEPKQKIIVCKTKGRGFYELTSQVQAYCSSFEGIGLCHLFIRHTSASLLITENADPEVHRDLERFIGRLVTDGDPLFQHIAEGPDDMPAHIRAALTQTALTVPLQDGELMLGTWQGIYLWEHRYTSHSRAVVMSLSC